MMRAVALVAALLSGQAAAAEELRIVPPKGYCIDKGLGTAIVFVGRCEGATQQPAALLTAAVGPPGSGAALGSDGTPLAAFFTSGAGRKALSRSGRAGSVRVLEAVGIGDAFLIHFTDTGPNVPGQPESWRAVLPLAGRMVTLTVTGPADAPLDRAAGRALTEAFLRVLRNANRTPAGG